MKNDIIGGSCNLIYYIVLFRCDNDNLTAKLLCTITKLKIKLLLI